MGEGHSDVTHSKLEANAEQSADQCSIYGTTIVVMYDVTHRLKSLAIMLESKLIIHAGRWATSGGWRGWPASYTAGEGAKGDNGMTQGNFFMNCLQNHAFPCRGMRVANNGIYQLVAEKIQIGNLVLGEPARLGWAEVGERKGSGESDVSRTANRLSNSIAAAI